MVISKFFKTTTIRKRYFLSYFLISLIPIIILCTAFYYLYVGKYEHDLQKSSISHLNQVKNDIDYIIKDFTYYALRISNDINTYNMINLKSANDSYSEINQVLKDYKEKIRSVSEICLYRRGDRMIHLSYGTIPYAEYENLISDGLTMTMSRIFSTFNLSTSIQIMDIENKNKKATMFLYPAPYPDSDPKATLTFIVDWDNIASITKNYFGEYNYSVFVVNSSFQPVYYSNSKLINDKSVYEKLVQLKGIGVFNYDINGNDQITIRTMSEDSQLIYYITMDRHEFYKETERLWFLLLAVAMTMIVVGVIFSAAFSFNNYKPIRKIVEKVELENCNNNNFNNEFELIDHYYTILKEENSMLVTKIDSHVPLIRRQFFSRIINGIIKKNEDIGNYLELLDIEFLYGYFLTIVIDYRDGTDLIEDVSNSFITIKLEKAMGYMYKLEREKTFVVVVNLDNEGQDQDQLRYDIALDVLSFAVKKVSINPILGVGKIYGSLKDCEASFLEAYAALSSREININDRIFMHKEDNISNVLNDFTYPKKDLKLYINTLRNGDINGSIYILNNLTNNICTEYRSFILMQYVCYDVINAVIKSISSADIDFNILDFKELSLFRSIEEFKSKMTNFTIYICNQIEINKKKEKDQLKNEILTYVMQNYTNIDFSLKMVSEKFNMSISYLSNYFKHEHGIGFNKFVSDLRVQHAKKLLRETDMPLQELVKNIGYIDTASFGKKFKKLENLTPGEYRERYTKK